MARIKEVILDNEKIYLKKDVLGYRIVNPIKNLDGSYNYFNLIFGGKRNLVILIVYLTIAGLLYIGINDVMTSCKLIAEQNLLYNWRP